MNLQIRTALYSAAILPEIVLNTGSKLTRPIRHHIAQARELATESVIAKCPDCKANSIRSFHTWASQEDEFCPAHVKAARKAYFKLRDSRKSA